MLKYCKKCRHLIESHLTRRGHCMIPGCKCPGPDVVRHPDNGLAKSAQA
jgi:hypothetical protein